MKNANRFHPALWPKVMNHSLIEVELAHDYTHATEGGQQRVKSCDAHQHSGGGAGELANNATLPAPRTENRSLSLKELFGLLLVDDPQATYPAIRNACIACTAPACSSAWAGATCSRLPLIIINVTVSQCHSVTG